MGLVAREGLFYVSKIKYAAYVRIELWFDVLRAGESSEWECPGRNVLHPTKKYMNCRLNVAVLFDSDDSERQTTTADDDAVSYGMTIVLPVHRYMLPLLL